MDVGNDHIRPIVPQKSNGAFSIGKGLGHIPARVHFHDLAQAFADFGLVINNQYFQKFILLPCMGSNKRTVVPRPGPLSTEKRHWPVKVELQPPGHVTHADAAALLAAG